jgi:3-hydroxyacyl-[acyl-carrier-protein] dehydratase
MKIDILTKKEIEKYLQISDPFLMIDIGRDIIPGKSANSIKYLDNDWFFECHLKNELAMPGTLQLEAMLQTLVLSLYTLEENIGKLAFVTETRMKLLKKVSPNFTLKIETNIISNKRGIVIGTGVGKIDEYIVCKGEFKLILPHNLPKIKII